jgi:hypothetical protein
VSPEDPSATIEPMVNTMPATMQPPVPGLRPLTDAVTDISLDHRDVDRHDVALFEGSVGRHAVWRHC